VEVNAQNSTTILIIAKVIWKNKQDNRVKNAIEVSGQTLWEVIIETGSSHKKMQTLNQQYRFYK
jgi:hypothetical protein